jgi:hypothetical protein
MEKKFEEKFGLKTEEMEEILGGVISTADLTSFCGILCSSCVGCSGGCTVCEACYICTTVAFSSATTSNNAINSAVEPMNLTDISLQSSTLHPFDISGNSRIVRL